MDACGCRVSWVLQRATEDSQESFPRGCPRERRALGRPLRGSKWRAWPARSSAQERHRTPARKRLCVQLFVAQRAGVACARLVARVGIDPELEAFGVHIVGEGLHAGGEARRVGGQAAVGAALQVGPAVIQVEIHVAAEEPRMKGCSWRARQGDAGRAGATPGGGSPGIPQAQRHHEVCRLLNGVLIDVGAESVPPAAQQTRNARLKDGSLQQRRCRQCQKRGHSRVETHCRLLSKSIVKGASLRDAGQHQRNAHKAGGHGLRLVLLLSRANDLGLKDHANVASAAPPGLCLVVTDENTGRFKNKESGATQVNSK